MKLIRLLIIWLFCNIDESTELNDADFIDTIYSILE